MRHPFRDKECIIFRKHTLIEDQEELASVWPQALDRMRIAGREIPQVAFSLARTFPRLRVSSEPGQCSRSQCCRAHSQDTPSRKPVLHPVALLLITHHILSLWTVNSTTLVLCHSSTSKKHARCQSSMDW